MENKYFDYIKNPANMTLLTEGGSERNFYRVSLDGKKTVVYMNYTGEKEENKYWYDIALLFKKLDINVPEIFYRNDGNIIIEDLGNTHLYNLVKAHDDHIFKYYRKAIDQILRLHLSGDKVYKKNQFKISNGFNHHLYRWESNYFMNNYVKNYSKIKIDDKLNNDLEKDFNFLGEVLSGEKNVLIHRDFQSKNIMVKKSELYFIDFQGMRYGLPQYDLASLVEDPYANLSEDFKDDLIDYYCSYFKAQKASFKAIYRYCAVQRLMQALGAYAFLGLIKWKKEFLRYIPNGVNNLKLILEEEDDLGGIKGLISLVGKNKQAPRYAV